MTKHGDHAYFESLVHRHARELYGLAYRLCGQSELAEDLVQETYSAAWQSITSLRKPEAARGWLFQILRRRYARHVRTCGRRPHVSSGLAGLPVEPGTPGPDILDLLADQELLQMALDTVDDRYKEPLLMVFVEGATCEEAARQLGIPLGTVLSRIHRARTMLRKRLRQLDKADPQKTGPEQESIDNAKSIRDEQQNCCTEREL